MRRYPKQMIGKHLQLLANRLGARKKRERVAQSKTGLRLDVGHRLVCRGNESIFPPKLAAHITPNLWQAVLFESFVGDLSNAPRLR